MHAKYQNLWILVLGVCHSTGSIGSGLDSELLMVPWRRFECLIQLRWSLGLQTSRQGFFIFQGSCEIGLLKIFYLYRPQLFMKQMNQVMVVRSLTLNSYGKSVVSPMFLNLLVLRRAILSPAYTSQWLYVFDVHPDDKFACVGWIMGHWSHISFFNFILNSSFFIPVTDTSSMDPLPMVWLQLSSNPCLYMPLPLTIGKRLKSTNWLNFTPLPLPSSCCVDALRSLYARANKKTTNNVTKGLYMYGS